MRILRVLVAVSILALGPGGARADVVHLQGGGRVEGRVIEHGAEVRVEVASGTLVFPVARVLRIERCASPAERLRAAAAELGREDGAKALYLVREADSAGLPALGDEILAAAAARAPEDALVGDALRRRRDRRESLPDAEGSEERMRRDFGAGAKILRTNHFIVVHDVATQPAAARADLLEVTWSKFHELARALELAPRRVDARLEVMLFASHERWLAAAGVAEERLRGMSGMSGIFVPRTRRVLLYDSSQSPEAQLAAAKLEAELAALQRAEDELASHERELDVLRVRLEEAEARSQKQIEQRDALRAYIEESRVALDKHRVTLDARRDELRQFSRRLDGWEGRESLAATTHEACHQLAFATGVGRPGEPRWLTEGLATLFEVDARESFVLEAPNQGRLRDVRAEWASGAGGDLRKVVSGWQFEDASASAQLAYSEAWALAHYLARRHPQAFARYVKEAALLPNLPTVAERRVAEFAEFFGADLDALQRDWRRFTDRL